MIAGNLQDPLAAVVILAAVASGLAAFWRLRSRSRRIEALNRSLHEVRRPLQVLALALPGDRLAVTPGGRQGPGGGLSGQRRRLSAEPLEQAISALSELDGQINGGSATSSRPRRSELVAVRLMVDACVRRWTPFARLAGAELRMAWTGPDVLVRGDGTALAAALENLISNAIEHGGRGIEVSGIAIGRKVRLVVSDTGAATAGGEGVQALPEGMGDLKRIAGHGHGLGVVESTVSRHAGKFETRFGDHGSEAVIVLPVSPSRRSGQGVKVNW